MNQEKSEFDGGIAIIGMAGRFPGARNVAEFWQNQRNGVESISRFTSDELEVPEAHRRCKDPGYVPARSVLDDVDCFDAAFFGIYSREAELMDPQHRVFLECCWEAIEDAGYDPSNCPGLTGVYAGASPATYFLRNVCADRRSAEEYLSGYQVQGYPVTLGSNGDFLSTRVSYKLNLKGPSFTVLSACSTSLLAVTQACQGLESYQCDLALAGGVSITFPQKRGYMYQEGGMVSEDGHCRTFDEKASGTVFGSGAGVVLLKRLEDAIAGHDNILAVIRGYGVNNDGAGKVGYTAPSVDGQAKVIAMAHAAAGIDPETITYVEAHGTATPLGDPIEVAALTQAFRMKTQARGFCAIGTTKTNVGHLDIAAGITGLIHAVQAIRHRELPPTLHFRQPNPKLNLEDSPFYVNTALREWKPRQGPRRAGVSAFGVGGTNVHVILEEPPSTASSSYDPTPQLLVLSAKSKAALDQVTKNLTGHLEGHPESNFADVAHTLRTGRHHFEHRCVLVASDLPDAMRTLGGSDQRRLLTSSVRLRNPVVGFLFPGQGAQYPGMGSGLYNQMPVFREGVDQCAEVLLPHLGFDLREILRPKDLSAREAAQRLTQTECAQAAIFTIEYALARLWKAWGIEPQAMVGHSVGEFVAACIAGVFSLEDALSLVAARGRMMQDLPVGAMLAIRMSDSEVMPLLNGSLSLAASNAPRLSVVAGPLKAVESLERELGSRQVVCRRLAVSHAFHSSMMEPVVGPFTERVRRIRLNAPRVPYVSTVTGTWISGEEATSPDYWGSHLRRPVRFSKAITELIKTPEMILIEVGPGATLSTLSRQHMAKSGQQVVISSLPADNEGLSDFSSMQAALGSLWLAGLELDWSRVYLEGTHRRVSLPTYPFERKRYWIDSPPQTDPKAPPEVAENSPVTRMAPEPAYYSNGQDVSCGRGDSPVTIGDLRNAFDIGGTNSMDAHARIRLILSEIIEELSGADLSKVEPGTSFLEMGFDSLFLTQVTQAIQTKLGLKVTFRQLLDQESTLETLATFVHRKLPPDRLPVELSVPAPSAHPPTNEVIADSSGTPIVPAPPERIGTAVEGTPSESTALERIVREQLQVMTQQLTMLRGTISPVPAMSSNSVSASMTPPMVSKPAPPPATANSSPSSVTEAGTPKQEFKAFGPYKPVQKGSIENLTPLQTQHLAALTERYVRRTGGSKRITQTYRNVLADPRVVAGFRAEWKELVYPIVTVRSRGSRLWDVDGNEYIDILNGFGPTVFGHLPDFVTAAAKEQLELGVEIGPQSPLAGQVAQMISEFTGLERVTFCNTGSEAVIAALRVARTVTGRKKIVLFSGSYHGTFDEVLVKGIKTKPGVPRPSPVAPGIPQESVDNVYVLEYGAPESLEFIRAHANELAAVLVEPVQSRHPALQPREFVSAIREITKSSETALILDEVVTGFRAHPGGIQALWNIRADLATYGKVLGGGFPIGVLAGSAEYMDALDGGQWSYEDDSSPEKGVTFFAGTFVRHPLALAACKSVLLYLKEQGPGLQERLNARTASLVKRINQFFEQNQVPTQIEQFSSMFYFSLPPDLRFGGLFYYYLREKGVHLQENRPCFLTTAHADADIEHIVRSVQETVLEMQAGGFLPARAGHETAAAVPANYLDGQAAPLSSTSPLESAEPTTAKEAPLTESQLEVLLLAQMGKEQSCCFNESISLRMLGELDEPALRAALQCLFQRHQALRATFSPSEEFQRFVPSIQLDLPVANLSNLDAGARDEQLRQLIDYDARVPFDLEKGPAVRTKLVRLQSHSHVLLFTAHHIVCDGWSTNIILDELSKLYSAEHDRKSRELPAPGSFETYTQSQAKHFESPDGAAIEEYWVGQFKDPVPMLDLPLDRPRSSTKAYEGATYRRRISPEAYRNIKKAGAQHKCTLFVTLLAGFQVLLSRLSGQDDIVVGVPAAGQSLLDDQGLVGHCVNFLPLRGRLAGDPCISDYLLQVKRNVLDAYEHQNYTYGRLIRKLSIPRDPSRLPLVEVQFNLERVGSSLEFSGLRTDVDPNPKAFVNHDLFLNVIESDQGIVLDCDYNTTLFDEETIDRWLGHYTTLLEGLALDSSIRVSRLPLLSNGERQRLAVEWNHTEASYPETRCVHQLFEEQACRTPNALAVVYEDQELTYGELNRRSNRLAQYLRSLKVGPGVLVGVFVDRSLEMIVGLLGVMKAGAAYVPMDPTYPAERISFILEDASVPVLLTQKKLLSSPSRAGTRLVYLDSNLGDIDPQSDAAAATVTPEDLAYIIYTSGSTGKPKGVEIPHRAVVNLLCSMSKKPGLDARDTLLAITTLSFDIAALELFLPLCVGAKLVIASREAAADGTQLLARLISSGATVIQATPVTFRFLIEAGWNGNPKVKVLCGGEALSRDLADQLLTRTSSLWNMYGPTETTIWSSTIQVHPGASSVSIGPPVDNTRFHVLDSNAQLCPIGVPGELHIGGDGLARGYFRRPELTAEKFIPDPIRNHSNARLYKTGDLVRRLPDGTLEFLGRLDFQVKLRGFRIELGEIETALTRYPGVNEAVVVLREDVPGDKRLVAYVTTDQQALTVTAVREFLTGKIPNYMLPAAVVRIDSMPLTPNGKVNRRALPAPDIGQSGKEKEFVAPSTSQERALAAIWAEVLRLERVGIQDNLFELGADSLHIFQIAARANKAGITIAPAQFLKYRTIASLLAQVGNGTEGGGKAAAPIIRVSREKYRVKQSSL